jgi:hypothetical protein
MNATWQLLKQKIAEYYKLNPKEVKRSRLEDWGKAIEQFEDYVLPGGRYRNGKLAPNGSISYRNRNPGNVRWSKYQISNNGYSIFKDYATGWKALLFQLQIAANGKSAVYRPDMNLRQFFEKYAPSLDDNYPEEYAAFVAKALGVPVSTQIKDLL